MKISVRLSVLVVLVSFVLIISLSLIYGVNNRFNDKLLSTVTDDIENTVEVCKDELSNSILRVQRAQDLLGVNKEFIQLLKTDSEDAIERTQNINKLVEYVDFLDTFPGEEDYGDFSYLFVDTSQPISDFLHKFVGEEIISSTSVGNFSSIITNEEMERFDWYNELLEGDSQMYIFEQSNAPNYVFLAQVINDDLSYTKEMLAVSLVGIDFENILRSYRSINNKSLLEIMIVNDKGDVVCTSDESVNEDVIEFASRYYSDSDMSDSDLTEVKISGDEYFVCKYDMSFGMTLVAAIPRDDACITIEEISREVFWIVALILFIALIIAVILSGVITKPVKNLADFMENTDEISDLSGSMNQTYIREIDSLYNAFNRMLLRIKHLIGVAQKMGEQKKEAEYKMLQAQINPHYLYNALDSIAWTALRKGDEDIAEMAEILAESFRSNAKGNDMMIDIENELLFVHNYVKLQEKCRNGKFNLDIDIADDLMGMKIPKFILQPLVENAIIHGMSDSGRMLTIRIRAEADDGSLKLYIEDNGAGFDTDALNRYLDGDNSVFDSERIGIINIHKRLQIKYGEQAGLHYVSNESGGVTVTVTLAKATNIAI